MASVTLGRVVHGAIILIALGVYTVFISKGLSSLLQQQMKTRVQQQLEMNPVMMKDYLKYKQSLEDKETDEGFTELKESPLQRSHVIERDQREQEIDNRYRDKILSNRQYT